MARRRSFCGRALVSCLKAFSSPEPKLEWFTRTIEISSTNKSYPACLTRFCNSSSMAREQQVFKELKHGLGVDTGQRAWDGYSEKFIQAKKAQLHSEKTKAEDGSMFSAKASTLFDVLGEELEEAVEKLPDVSVEILAGMSARQELKKNLKRLLEICRVEVWGAHVEEALMGEFSAKLTPTLVNQAVKRMKPDVAKEFFAWAGKQESHRHLPIYRSLFRSFLRAGKPEGAKEVLREMEEKGVRVEGKLFNELILHYAKAGMLAQAEEMVDMMKSSGFSPDVMKVHGALIDGYFKVASNEGQASRQEGKEELNYAVLFDDFLRAGKLRRAKEVVEEMKENDMAIDSSLLVQLIQRCWIDGTMADVEEAVDMMKASFGCSDSKLHAVLLAGYLQASDKESAGRLLQGLLKADDYEAAIVSYARAGKADVGLKVLRLMEKNGFVASVNAYVSLIYCLCRVKMIDQGLKLLADMEEKNMFAGVRAYNILITRLWRNGRMEEALNLISRMKENGCQPDMGTHNCIIAIYLKLRQVEKARVHLEEMKTEYGCMPGQETFELFINYACRVGEVEGALGVFHKAVESNYKLHVGACNRLLKGLIKERRIDVAFEVFEKMRDGVCQEDTSSSYAVLLRGSCGLSRFDVIHRLLGNADGVELPRLPVCTFVEILQAYDQAGKLKEAATLFWEVERSRRNVFGATLDALGRAKQLDLRARFCDCLANEAAQGGELQLLDFLRLLVKAGRVGEARELMKSMVEKGCMDKEGFEDLFSLLSNENKT